MDVKDKQITIAMARFCKPIIKTLRVASNLCYTTALIDYGTVTGFMMVPCGLIGHAITDGIETGFVKSIGQDYGRTPEQAVARFKQARHILRHHTQENLQAAYQNTFHKNASGQHDPGMVIWEGVQHYPSESRHSSEAMPRNVAPEFTR